MDETLIILFVLGVLTCTLVGAITILVWLFRLVGGSQHHQQTQARRREQITPDFIPPALCNACGAPFSLNDLFCMQCGTRRGVKLASPEADAVAAERALKRLFQAAQIDEATYNSVSQALTAKAEPAPFVSESKPATTPATMPTLEAVVPAPRPVPTALRVHVAQPAEKTEPAPEPLPLPAVPRRSFAEMMAAFMEESSIRWGELVGGLLIIGCSLALVVSLWSEIAERPVLKFSVFMTMTAALFGLGFYSAHRWKLPTTSRGVLLTATLLVPLNFLAVTALGRASVGLGIVLAEIAAWLLFAFFVWQGARVYALAQAGAVTFATMGSAFALLLAKHAIAEGWHWRSWLVLGMLPVACLTGSVAWALQRARKVQEPEGVPVYTMFALLGTGVFAAVLPLGLLLARGGLTRQAWYELVPLVAALGVPLMAVGWFLWRRLRVTKLANERTIAAALCIAGTVSLVGCKLLAFPLFDSMLAVAALNVSVFAWAAWRYNRWAMRWLAAGQTVYLAALLLQWTLGHLALGVRDGAVVINALASTSNGNLLLVFAVAFAVIAEWLRAQNERPMAIERESILAAALCCALGFGLVSWNGFALSGDPQRIVWSYALVAALTAVMAWRRSFGGLVWLAWMQVGCLSVQACVYALQPSQQWVSPWAIALAGVLTLSSAVALGALPNQKAKALFSRRSLKAALVAAVGLTGVLAFEAEQVSGWYLLPLVWAGAAWALYAWQTRSGFAAFVGGLHFNVAASLALLCWLVAQNMMPFSLGLTKFIQVNVAVAALYVSGWRALKRWYARSLFWVKLQARAVTAVQLAWLGVAAAVLVLTPTRPSALLQTTGDRWGWIVSGLVAAMYWLAGRREHAAAKRVPVLTPLAFVLASGAQLAATWHRWESWTWQPYHVLLWTALVSLWLAVALCWFVKRVSEKPSHSRLAAFCVNVISAAVFALGWRALAAPGGVWRSVLAWGTVSAVLFGMQMLQSARGYAYVSALMGCATLTLWIVGYATGDGTLADVAFLNGSLLAAIALASLVLELRKPAKASAQLMPPFHQFASVVLLGGLTAWVGAKLWADLNRDFSQTDIVARGSYSVLIFVSLAALLVGGLYDARYRWRFAALYCLGWLSLGATLDRFDYSESQLLCAVALLGLAFAGVAALLWRGRHRAADWLRVLRVPIETRTAPFELLWLRLANAFLASGAVLIALLLAIIYAPWSQRLATALAALSAPFVLGAVLGKRHQRVWRTAVFLLGFGSLLACGWLVTQGKGFAQYTVFTALALVLSLIFAAGEALPLAGWDSLLARLGDWQDDVRLFLHRAGAVGICSLSGLVGIEWLMVRDLGQVESAVWVKLLATAVIVALLVCLIGFALWRGSDPLGLEREKRSAYVYAAEIGAVVLFAHARLAAPWLFGGRFQAYWPVFILVLAFLGVTIGEQLQRRGRSVLGDPLSRTGVFLPLLPSLAFGLVKSNVDYAGVLLGVALFYGLLSIMRQSFGFGLLAVIAANGGWWHWLQRSGDFGFFAHPQVWLIPAALSLLLAAHLNRQQLSLEQLTTLRYVSLMTIYLSSTADIFLNGVADSPWLPLILAILSIGGVMTGIMLRVRAYLFLGTSFLMLAVITLVWHAAVSFGWRWLWYVAGIAFGMMIIYLFAMFERHRAAWLLWMERFKTWQA